MHRLLHALTEHGPKGTAFNYSVKRMLECSRR